MNEIRSAHSSIIAARCHEIQTSLGRRDAPEYDQLIIIGMAVRVALHIRGLAKVDYHPLMLVCSHYLDIPPIALKRVVELLAEIEFVYLQKQGSDIKFIVPNVPYYEDLYLQVGEYIDYEVSFNEAEQLTLAIVDRLADSPENLDRLRNIMGADNVLFERNIRYGEEGRFLIVRRHRGRDIIINPAFFSENAEIFADYVAATNSNTVASLLQALRQFQGWPLKLIEQNAQIGSIEIAPDQVGLLKRLAQDGAVKPPSIKAEHSGDTNFLFTPVPAAANISPTKRDIYEKAMAVVAAVRQGQLLPRQYSIRNPAAILYTLKTNLKLSRATTEASHQYKNLAALRVGQLIPVGGDYYEFRIIDTPENREALDMAYDLITQGEVRGLEVDKEIQQILDSPEEYQDSLTASAQLRERERIDLTEEQREEMDNLFLEGIS